MILHRILDHDLHMARGQAANAYPYQLETQGRPGWFPLIVSGLSWDKYLVAQRIHPGGKIMSGIFRYDPDRIDDVIMPLFMAAYELSVSQNWRNINPDPLTSFRYIQKSSGSEIQPHVVLIPEGWSRTKLFRWGGREQFAERAIVKGKKSKSNRNIPHIIYRRICRVVHAKVVMPIFLSQPDYVGTYTQITGGLSSIILHNVRRGISFCPPFSGD